MPYIYIHISIYIEIPLLNWLVDTYLRYKVNRHYQAKHEIDTTQFANEYKFFKNKSNARAVDKLQASIASFFKRLVPEIAFNTLTFIDDDINQFADYYVSMCEAIDIMLKEKENRITPFQIDMWVIPKNVLHVEEYEDKKENDDRIKFNIDMIGNLEYRLKKDSDSFEFEKFDGMELTPAKLSRFFSQQIVAKLDNKRYQRIIIYIDRRDPKQTEQMKGKYFKSNYGQNDEENKWDHDQLLKERKDTKKSWKDTIYIVQSKDIKFSELKETYRAETWFWASSKCMLPRCKSCPFEKRTKTNPNFGVCSYLNGYQFCLSWHIDAADFIRCYWYHNVWGTRFFPYDACKLWPKYFKKVQNGKKLQHIKKDNTEKIMKMRQVVDAGFEKWYKLTTGESVIV